MPRANLCIYSRPARPLDRASNGGMSTMEKFANHTQGDDEMTRWKYGVRRIIFGVVISAALSGLLGYVSSIYAAANASDQERVAIQQAVNTSRIDTLSTDQAKILARLDTIDVRQAVISDRLSQMVGIGMGGMGVLSVLSALGIGLHLKRARPAAA